MAFPDWDTPLSKQDVSPRELVLAMNEINALPVAALAGSPNKGPVASNPASALAAGATGQTLALSGLQPSGNTTILGVTANATFAGNLIDIKDPASVSRLVVDFNGLASMTTIQFDTPGTAHQIQMQSVGGVNGRRLSISSGDTQGPTATGSAELQIAPANTAPTAQLTGQAIIYGVVGADYERFSMTWFNSQWIFDSTFNGAGVARNIYFQMGGSVGNSITGRTAIAMLGNGSTDIVGSSTFLAQGVNWYVTGARISDPENQGSTRLTIDTRTGTPASNTADSSFLRFSRGGSLKFSVGLNAGGGNTDSLDHVAAAATGKFVFKGSGNAGNNVLAIIDTDASGHEWDIGEMYVVGSLSFRDFTAGGQPEVMRLAGATKVVAINAAGGLDTIAAGTLTLGPTTATAVQVGRTGQSVGFYGTTPVVKAGAITTPTAPSAAYVQAEAQSMKTAVDAIRVALTNIGITA